jgi:imidazolonepropionase-like amidohydrolase
MGIKVVAGTDGAYAAKTPVRLTHEVLELNKLGFTPLEAIQAGTIVSAEMLSLEASIGSVEAGKEADLVVYDLNPLENLFVIQEPLLVVNNGRVAVNKLEYNVRRGGTRE